MGCASMLPAHWNSAFTWIDDVRLPSPTAIWANVFLLILTALVKIAFTAWTFGMMVCRMSRQARPALHDAFLGSSWYLPPDNCDRCMHGTCCWVNHVRTPHCCPLGFPNKRGDRQGLYRAYPGAWIFSSCPPDLTVRCISPGFYAVIGAAAMLGGVTRMTSKPLLSPILATYSYSLTLAQFLSSSSCSK